MKDAFFKTAARSLAFGFSGAPLDRISDKREDLGFHRGPARTTRRARGR